MNFSNNENFIGSIFSRIAKRYDLVNRCVSLGSHVHWTNKFVDLLLNNHTPQCILDLCCGTGAITQTLLHRIRKRNLLVPTVDCVDFCPQMLAEAQKKLSDEVALIRYIRANATSLPLPDNMYDTVLISYGIRNICNRERALQEIARVLRPKGKLFILELTRPNALVSPFMRVYLQLCIPAIGGLLTGQWRGYKYLASSIYSFSTSSFINQLNHAGFSCKEVLSNSYGLLTLVHAEKL